jgi:hypothetical protein
MDGAMGERGCTHHIRRTDPARLEELLTGLGGRYGIVGSNGEWTSFVPLGEDPLETAAIARLAGAVVTSMWFDDDAGASLGLAGPDGWRAELAVSLEEAGDEAGAPSGQDPRLVDRMVERGVLDAERGAELIAALARPAGERERWVRSHGLEEILGFPATAPLPVPCTEELFAELEPEGRRFGAGRPWPAPEPESNCAAVAGAPRRLVPGAVVDLHFHYLARMWTLNGWRLYSRYKKHLPAERRREVDALVDLIMRDHPEGEIRAAIEDILGSTWDAEDWVAVMREPKILDDATRDPEERETLARLLEAASSADD